MTPILRPLALILLVSWSITTGFSNWPEFRGPDQNGHADPSSKIPTTWSEEENVVWKTEIHDKGWSTPVIWDDQIWFTTATEDGTRQYGICVDKESGKILYDKELFYNAEPRPLGNDRNTYASPSPVIEEGRVYLHFGSYGTACIDTKTFETLWERRDLPCHHWRGPASSPVIYEDLLILTFDGADYQYLAALNKKTGETVWKKDRSTNYNDLDENGVPAREGDFRKAYNTPVFMEVNGKTQMISVGAKAAWSYAPESGEEIWSLHWTEHSAASRPVFSKELDHMYLNTGFGKAKVLAVKLDPNYSGEIPESQITWSIMSRTPNRCSPVLVENRLYMVTDGGVGMCVDALTGEDFWTERTGESYSSSLLYANGCIYFFDEMGNSLVVKDSETYEVVAENKLDDGTFACPSVDGDALYLRTVTHLYRIEDK